MTGYEIEKEHALKIIKAMRTNWDENSKTPNANALDKAIEALEKQIPKEIKQEINGGRFERYCPNSCQITTVTMYTNIKYCPYCGQAIKWE